MDQAQVQVRIVVNDAGGGIGGGAGAGGSAGQSNAGAASRQPVGTTSANVRNATLSPDDLRQLKDLIAERRRLASRGGSNRQNSGDGDRARSTLESVQNLTQAIYGLRPSLGSVGQALTAAGELTGSKVLAGAGATFTAAQAVVLFGQMFKTAVADVTPQLLAGVLAAIGVPKDSAFFKSVMAGSADISNKIAAGVIAAGSVATAAESTFQIGKARARLGGRVDAAELGTEFVRQFEVDRQRREIEEYIQRDVKQEKVYDVVNQLRSAAMAKLGN